MLKIKGKSCRAGSAFCVIAFLLILLSVSLDAFGAESSDTNSLFSMSLEDLMKVEITSSARRSQSLNRASRAVYVITAEDIRQAGPVRIEELFRQVPGMDVFRTKGLVYEVGSRGFAKWSNERMQVLLDGRPLYDPYLGGTLFYLNPVFLDEIERIEVIRGSGGVVWGVNAMNGVINIITKKAADTQGGLVSGSVGSRELQQGFIRYGGTDGPFSYRGMVGTSHEKGFTRDYNGDINRFNGDDYDAFQSTVRGELKLDDDKMLTFTGGQQNAGEALQYMNLLFEKTFDDDSKFQIRWTESYITRNKNNWKDDPDWGNWLGGDTRSHEEMVEVQYNFVRDKHNFVLGADYTRDMYSSTTHMAGQFNPTSPSSFANDQVSAFIEDEITLADNLWYTIGFRGHYNEFTNYDWAGSMALVWEFTPKHFIRGAISKAFRRPTIREEFLNSSISWGKFGNDSLKNEESVSYEVGYRGQWAKNVSVNVEGYVNQTKDLISLETLTVPSWHQQFKNMYNVTTYGVETSVDWRPVDWWLIRGFHTYMHQSCRNELTGYGNGDKLDMMLSPQQRAGLTNRFYLDKSTTLNTQLYWTGAGITKSLDTIEETDSTWRLDVRLARSIWKDTAELAIGVTNLFDQSHTEGGRQWSGSATSFTEIPGRQFYFQFFYKF
ncbi:MAG: TonB-dependent receptor [Phycisphaerae bacterium]|jgi:iron complex outermembrane receptor protein